MTPAPPSNRPPGPRSPAAPHPAALRLTDDVLVRVHLEPGDRLRAESGTVWATVPGQLHDIVLRPGRSFSFDTPTDVDLAPLRAATACVVRIDTPVPRAVVPQRGAPATPAWRWLRHALQLGLRPAVA